MQRRLFWYVALAAATAVAAVPQLTMAAPQLSSPGVGQFVTMESTGPVFDVLYRWGHNDAAADGAFGPNTRASRTAWWLEYQRAGGYNLIAGVVRGDINLIREGLRMLHFGLAREARDGSFPGSISPFHGTAMFLSEAAPGLVMLARSQFAPQIASEMQWQIGQMRRAAYHLLRLEPTGKLDDPTKDHRYFEAALAYGAVGLLAADSVLVRVSRAYAWTGIRLQHADGVMPEDGGHDSGYQALGMVNASRYLELVSTGKLSRALWQALRRGEQWELSRVGNDGSVNQRDDTRTSGCREHDLTGRCKTLFYAPIFSALAHWARIANDLRYASAAFIVWERSGYGGK